eukprot:6973942-Pyramimonas_sp.AAC.1
MPARLLEGPQDQGARSLRSLQHEWGRPLATPREWAQISTANDMYRAALYIMYVCLASGACGILEHPACPSNQ